MKFLALLALALLASGPASAHDKNHANEALYAPAAGSTAPVQSRGEPAMYPGAKAQRLAQIRAQPASLSVSSAADVSQAVDVSDNTDDYLAWGILAFTLLALCIEAFVVVKAQKPWSPQSILRVFGLTIIVPLAVFLIVAGYSENQIAPVIGLLGVIAGYLLGNNDKQRTSA